MELDSMIIPTVLYSGREYVCTKHCM